MKKEFVTFEIAKKLTELGFKEKCMGYYELKDEYEGCTDAECDNFNSTHFKLTINYSYHNDEGYINAKYDGNTAPLWQQTIDWLLVKHDVLVRKQFQSWEVVTNNNGKEVIEFSTHNIESALLKSFELITKK